MTPKNDTQKFYYFSVERIVWKGGGAIVEKDDSI